MSMSSHSQRFASGPFDLDLEPQQLVLQLQLLARERGPLPSRGRAPRAAEGQGAAAARTLAPSRAAPAGRRLGRCEQLLAPAPAPAVTR